jgi:hypothetical protein
VPAGHSHEDSGNLSETCQRGVMHLQAARFTGRAPKRPSDTMPYSSGDHSHVVTAEMAPRRQGGARHVWHGTCGRNDEEDERQPMPCECRSRVIYPGTPTHCRPGRGIDHIEPPTIGLKVRWRHVISLLRAVI